MCAPAEQLVLHQRLQGEQVSVSVLRQDRPHGFRQFQQVLRVLPTGTSTADDLIGYLLERGGAQEVGVAWRADVKQRLLGRGAGRRAGVEGDGDDLVAALFPVVQVALHFLLPARRQLVGHAPNAALRQRRSAVIPMARPAGIHLGSYLRVLHQGHDPAGLGRQGERVSTTVNRKLYLSRVIRTGPNWTHLARDTPVVGAPLPEPTAEAFDVANPLVFIRKIHLPDEGAVSKNPHGCAAVMTRL